jgi:hypothetical protein
MLMPSGACGSCGIAEDRDAPPLGEKQLNPFERYLIVWVALRNMM